MNSNFPNVLRLGLVGVGKWGRNYVRTIQGLPGVRLAAICSRKPEVRSLVPPDCLVTPVFAELLQPGLLHGLIIATPPQTHAAFVESAVYTGLPCIVEKPFVLDLASARSLQALVTSRKSLVLVNHIHLFNPAYRALKRAAISLGRPCAIHSEGGNWGPFRPDYTPLWDYAPHDLSLCLDLAGSPARLARAQCLALHRQDGGIAGTYRLDIQLPHHAFASILVSNLSSKKVRRLVVEFEAGTLIFDDLAEHKLVNAAGEILPFEDSPPLKGVLEAFVAGLRGQPAADFGLDLAVEVIRLLEEAEPIIDQTSSSTLNNACL